MRNGIYIAGPDGSGKTTILKDLEYVLNTKNLKTAHIWIRSPKIFSKPLMAYCRLVGLTEYKNINRIRFGKHNFGKSAFVSKTFPLLQLIDFNIKWFIEKKKIKQNEIVLFDRFSIDTLADLMVSTQRFDLHKSYVGKKLIETVPKDINMILLDVQESTIRNRKSDTLHDELLADKIKAYQILGTYLNVKIIDNNKNYNDVLKEVLHHVSI